MVRPSGVVQLPAAAPPEAKAVTEKESIDAPPSSNGGVHETETSVFPGVATSWVGGEGGMVRTSGLEGSEGVEVPARFVAVTVKV